MHSCMVNSNYLCSSCVDVQSLMSDAYPIPLPNCQVAAKGTSLYLEVSYNVGHLATHSYIDKHESESERESRSYKLSITGICLHILLILVFVL